MLELNVYSVVVAPVILTALYVVWSRVQKPLAYRQLSSHVPSATRTLWSEIRLTLSMSMKQPKDILPFFMDLVKTYGPVVHFNLSGRSHVLLNDPEDIKILLSSKENITKGPEYKMLKPWLNEGLLLSTGSKWQIRRKLLTDTFHFKALDMYNPTMNKNARTLAKKLLEAFQNEGNVSVMDHVTLCSLDAISDSERSERFMAFIKFFFCYNWNRSTELLQMLNIIPPKIETIMGTQLNAQDGKSVEYVQSIKSACRSVIKRVFTFWFWNDVIFGLSECGRTFYKSVNVLHNFTDNVIKNKRISLNTSKNQEIDPEKETKKKSFIDILFSVLDDNPDQMTDLDIREEVDTFLFEGHDTSSISIAMTLVLLGIYSDVQDQARNEQLNIFGDSDRDVTMDDLKAMKYLEVVVKESLRLYPSVPGITREIQSTLQIKNYSIPPMTVAVVYPYILHRSPNIFPNPDEFIPERFLDEDNKSKFHFAYLPFSAGPRNCIGQKFAMNQIKTIVSTVLRKMIIKTLGSKEDIKISTNLIIRIESLPKMELRPI